ncbi:hypothetical protein Trydic_g3273 [Trypoxylus dichotomus]
MTDTAARREARRKRILENSESRLRRITSLNQDGVEDDKPKHNLNSEGSGSVSNSYTSTLEDHESVGEDEEIGSARAAPSVEKVPQLTHGPLRQELVRKQHGKLHKRPHNAIG